MTDKDKEEISRLSQSQPSGDEGPIASLPPTPAPSGALADLLAKVESAEGPDRELDGLLHVTLHGWKLAKVPPDYDGKNAGEVWTPDGKLIEGFAHPNRGEVSPYYHVPSHPSDKVHYTSSVDDALFLVGWLLPSWQVNIWHYASAGAAASIGAQGYQTPSQAKTPALAILAAALRTLAAQQTPPSQNARSEAEERG